MSRTARILCLATLSSTLLLPACGDPEENTDEDVGISADAVDTRPEVGRDVFIPDTRDIGGSDTGEDAQVDGSDAEAPDAVDGDALDSDAGPGVGPAGGRINFPGGYLDVPAGAIADLTEITITKANVFPQDVVVSGDIWRFEPTGLEFDLPVEACFLVRGVRPANVSVFWSALGDERDVAPIPAYAKSGHLCGKTEHFSIGFMAAWDDAQCDNVDCPAGNDICTGDTLQLSGLGTCRDGECSYARTTVDCSASAGGSCRDGECVGPAECGNGRREGSERCDGSDLGGGRCTDFGFLYGTPGCNEDCTFDLSSCSGDRCDSISCEPGPAFCEGDTAVVRTGGTCDAGSCLWDEERTDCTLASHICVEGACISAPSEGDLVITEFMPNPHGTESQNEWFEVRCDAEEPMSLLGLRVWDEDSDSFTVTEDITLNPGEYFVFAASETAVPDVGYAWGPGNYSLSNNADEIILSFNSRRIDRVAYTRTWHGPEGYSISLDPEATDNGERSAWCTTLAPPYRGNEHGTPGFANPTCTTVCGDGVRQGSEECDDGNLEPGDGCDAECRIEVDECEGVRCDNPPSSTCDGNFTVVYERTGTCEEGSCSYGEVRTDCGELDCVSGACLRQLSRGDLIITEFLARPLGSNNEFFEVYNASGEDIDLRGIEIRDAGIDTVMVVADEPVMVRAGEYFVFGDGTSAGGGEVGWSWRGAPYPGFVLANSGDEIILEMNGVIIDEVDYDRVPITNLSGVSSSLIPSALDVDANDLAENWCSGSGAYDSAGNQGSPGLANPPCPGCGDGIVQEGEECDDGNNEDGDGCAADCTIEPLPECELDTDCATPPATVCDGELVVTYALPGTCAEGSCTYASSTEDCAAVENGRCGAGACYVASGPAEGDIIITEIMIDPDAGGDLDREWFEITNVSGNTHDLNGLVVSDLGHVDGFTVEGSLILAPNGVALLAGPLADFNTEPDYRWGNREMAMSNSNTDAVILTLGDVELDRVVFNASSWARSGQSIALDPAHNSSVENDERTNWCYGQEVYFLSGNPSRDNRGTPGQLNPACE